MNALEPVAPGDSPANSDDLIAPLPGEPGIPDITRRRARPVAKKGVIAVAFLVITLIAASALSIQRWVASGKHGDDTGSKRISDRPMSAGAEPRRIEFPPVPATLPASSPNPMRIPAILASTDEPEPIGIRRSGAAPMPASTGNGGKAPPADGSLMIVVSRAAGGTKVTSSTSASPSERNSGSDDTATAGSRERLDSYQRQLQALLDSLTRSSTTATAATPATGAFVPLPGSGATTSQAPAAATGLFGGQLQGSATPRATAGLLGQRSLTLPKGTAFTCALKTRVVSATSGLVGCQVQRNVYSDDGRVLLVERGSHLDGEYRVLALKPGSVRIPVIWTRIRTPEGVVVDVDSPGTGPLGESGIDGVVDNRWLERIGAAMLLSLIDDSVKLVIQSQQNERQGDTVVLPATTGSTSKLAEKVLDSTINIPPLIYQNRGGIVGIYVARDLDFSSVYQLKAERR